MKIGFITDIHENVQMLSKALRQASLKMCDELVCLGDIVGYDSTIYKYPRTRNAKACLNLVRANCKWIVAGNHDYFAAGKLPVNANGFSYPENWFSMSENDRRIASQQKVWHYSGEAGNNLEEVDLLFLASLPEYIITSEPGINCMFSHYVNPDVTGSTSSYVKRNHHLNTHWEFMRSHQISLSFTGHAHTHFPGFAYPAKKRQPGSSYYKAINAIPSDSFVLGPEPVVISLPPVTGEKGRNGFSVLDTTNMRLTIHTL